MRDYFLELKDLQKSYQDGSGIHHILKGAELKAEKTEKIAILGSSGCGKSTLITSIIRQLDDNADIPNGLIEFEKQDLLKLSQDNMRNISGTKISIVFQNPMSTLNPVISIGRQMIDIQYRDKISKKTKKQRSIDMLTKVGIPDPHIQFNQYPHELSGGMQQRVSIAMALQAGPSLLIADEPTTALDATLEVQILKLLKELQEEMGCSILFVSHHLGVIAELCDHVVVMYAGQVVEQGSTYEIFNKPAHPYTIKLLECDPASISQKQRLLPSIPGEIPDLTNLSGGCIFKNRCDQSIDRCDQYTPILKEFDNTHFVSCHLTEL